MKKVLLIAGRPRKDGNSDLVARQFAKGAAEIGNEVETVYLREKKLNYCQGCLVCLKKGECFQKDDANSLLPKMMEADVVCFSCPVYYYSVCGQMKVVVLSGKRKEEASLRIVTRRGSSLSVV
jgi:multimeric flavodoxin WrbA